LPPAAFRSVPLHALPRPAASASTYLRHYRTISRQHADAPLTRQYRNASAELKTLIIDAVVEHARIGHFRAATLGIMIDDGRAPYFVSAASRYRGWSSLFIDAAADFTAYFIRAGSMLAAHRLLLIYYHCY